MIHCGRGLTGAPVLNGARVLGGGAVPPGALGRRGALASTRTLLLLGSPEVQIMLVLDGMRVLLGLPVFHSALAFLDTLGVPRRVLVLVVLEGGVL